MAGAGKREIRETQEQLFRLSEDAEKLADDIQALSAEELLSEMGALQLRLKRLLASFGACERRMQEGTGDTEPDPAEEVLRMQLAASAASERRWLTELAETLKESRRSLELSDWMKKKAFDARLSAVLEGRKDL